MNIEYCVFKKKPKQVTVFLLSVCLCVWKGLSPSVKKPIDNQKSTPGPNQGTKGDASVTKTGTAVTAECASMHCVSENVVC